MSNILIVFWNSVMFMKIQKYCKGQHQNLSTLFLTREEVFFIPGYTPVKNEIENDVNSL